ncbi:MAG TPA: serine hydrolase domain-containing protein [Chryseolinea sp.]|nr:serine hydrolase domain-containing protein [Chryseolinea sp.]
MKLQSKYLVLLMMCAIISMNAFPQKNVTMRMDSLFRSLYQYGEINGNVLIAEHGHIIYKKSFGYAGFEHKVPNTDSSRFTLSSVSKVFTSTAVLQLRDSGRFSLDDPLIKYLPDFPYPDITIRHLLSHTSGLPDYGLYEELIAKSRDKIFSNKDVLPSLRIWNKPLSFKPGEKWEYSNTNFSLLALLVEKTSGMTFQQYVQEYIFSPAKMTDTYFLTDPSHSKDENRVTNYEFPFLYSTQYKNVDSLKKYRWRLFNASGFVGQGNIMTTTGDMVKFDNALYAGKIIRLSTLDEAFTPAKLNNGKNTDPHLGVAGTIGKASYGLGWFIFADTSAGKIVWHTGGQPGSISIFLRNITKRQMVILFDNTFHKSLYANGVNALSVLNDKPIAIPKKSLTQGYSSALIENGVDAAFCKLLELRADSIHYYLSEDDMNEMGLQLLYSAAFDKNHQLALEVLKLNTLLFPESFNTYDSYGEALAYAGKKQEAVLMYKKSLELNPDNETGKRALKRILNGGGAF